MNQENIINSSAIDRLVKMGGQKFALEMIGLFASYGGKKLDEARQACSAGNLKALADAAHPLKSSAGNVGAERVQTLAAAVEFQADVGHAESAGYQLNELEQAFAEAVSALEIERARLSSPIPEAKP